MHIRRWVLTPLVVGALAVATALSASASAQQQPPKKDKKLEKAQQAELQAAARIADAAMAGQNAPSDIKMSLSYDSLKAQEGRTFVPFTLSIDPATLPSKAVTVYLRVVKKDAAAPAPDAKNNKDKKKGNDYTFEDVYFIDLKTPEAGKPYRIQRAFAVPAGEYDLYFVTKERLAPGAKEKDQAAVKAGVLKQTVTVPDYWNGDLTTSSVILADKIEPLTAPPSPQEQIEQPYTLGMTQIVPADDTTFSKKDELSVVFLIYNTQVDANRKPDVVVDYEFYRKTEGAENGEKFFNKTQPQAFNASTLPAQFDTAQGHQLVAGQSIPLASFPEGVYRLGIKITDKLSGKSITRDLTFTVVP